MIKVYRKVRDWVDAKPPIVSSVTHGIAAGLLVLFGGLLVWVSSLAGTSAPPRFDVFFYGFAIGAFAWREAEDAAGYLEADDSKGLGDSFVDFWIPVAVATFVFAVVLGSQL